MVQINGESKDAANKNLYQYLVDEGFDISRVVVELNLEIVPAEDLKNITIKDSDSIEVLRFVGGG